MFESTGFEPTSGMKGYLVTQSRMEKLLESSSRERLFSGSPYKMRDRELGFRTRVPDRTRTEYVQVRSVPKQPSPSEQEWRAMEAEIKAADFVLGIQNDSELEDFVPYARETLSRATSFLRRLMIHAHTANLINTGVPRIGPADQGSIDLYWEMGDRTLLINFLANESIANYYGRKPKSEISGRFDPSEPRAELVFWLAD
jgi:hypothetical protein